MSIDERLANGIVDWLIFRQMPSGGIRGDGDVESPADHYAHSFGALAIAIRAEKEHSPELWERAERAAFYTMGQPAQTRSVQEFNSLALLMLANAARSSGIASERLRDSLESLIRDEAFLYDGGRLVSNNWLAMRAVCFLMRGRLTADEKSHRRGEALLRETLDWQLEDGVFVDYPRKLQGGYATPLTYHAKMCAILALSSRYTQQVGVLPALKRGLSAIVGLMSPSGECLYYGRSCNSLFGLAAVYFALRTAQDCIPDFDWDCAARRILTRLEYLEEADGHLRLTPAGDEKQRFGWDVYFHTEVYNAYAAALLLSAPKANSDAIVDSSEADARSENRLVNLAKAGLIAIRGPQFFAALSTSGQCVLDGSSLFCDMRYAGLQPLLMESDGRVQIPEPPLWWKGAQSKSEAVEPRRVGFVPYITWQGRDYCARVFDQISIDSGEGWYVIIGNGRAISLSLPNRAVRLMRRVKGRLSGRGDLAFTPTSLPNLLVTRAIFVFPARKALLFIDGIEGDWPNGALWNGPDARIMPGTGMVVRNLMDSRNLTAHGAAPTSRGDAEYHSCYPLSSSAPSPGCVSAAICAHGDIEVRIRARGHQIDVVLDEINLCLNLQTRKMEPAA